MLKKLNSLLKLFGVDFSTMVGSIKALPWFITSWRQAKYLGEQQNNEFPFGKLYPCLGDRNDDSGVANGAYFHQDLLVARRIFAANPQRHIDVGSRIDGFVAHVASFREIEVVDIRTLVSTVANIVFRQADLMDKPAMQLLECCDSLSCLHALEHFGLGRYGDPLNLNGHRTGFNNMTSMLKAGGRFYLSVPIGPQRIEFNAHRVFSVGYLLALVADQFTVQSFSYVDDGGNLHENVPLAANAISLDYGCDYGCGILELVKKQGIQEEVTAS